jgi:hypothetical protein
MALLAGPIALMVLTDGAPRPTRAALLAAESTTGSRVWSAGALRFKSFSDIKDEPYTTYLRVTA